MVPGLTSDGESVEGPLKGQASHETRRTTLTLIIKFVDEISKGAKTWSLIIKSDKEKYIIFSKSSCTQPVSSH